LDSIDVAMLRLCDWLGFCKSDIIW